MSSKFFVFLLAVSISGSSYAFTDSLWLAGAGGYPGDLISVEVWLQYEGGGVGDSMSAIDILLTWDATVCTVEALTVGPDFAEWMDMSRIDNQGLQGSPSVPKLVISAFTWGPPVGAPYLPRGTHLAATLDFRILNTVVPPDSTCIDTLMEGFTPTRYLGFLDKSGFHTYVPLFAPHCIRVLEHLAILDGSPQTVNESAVLSFVVQAKDADPAHLITLEATYLPIGAVFPPVSGYDSVKSTFTWEPSYCDARLDSAVFHASCPTTNKYVTTLITVNNINRAPSIDGGPNRTVAPGNTLVFTVNGRDQDYRECGDDTLTFGALNLPPTATFAQDSDTTGIFSWTPEESDTGMYTVTFTVADLAAASDSDDVMINVAYTLDSLIAVVRSYACPGLVEFGVPIVSVNFRPVDRYTFFLQFDSEVLSVVRVDSAGTASSGALSFRADMFTSMTPPDSLRVACRMPDDHPIPVGKNTLAYVIFAVDSGVVAPDTTVIDLTRGDQWSVLVDGYLPIEPTCCGDVNGDGKILVSDAIYLASYIYHGGEPPVADGDVNLDGKISIADGCYLIGYLYRNGTPPCQPPFLN